MSKKKIDATIQIAQKLVNHLPKEMDNELKILIQRANKGQDTTIEIIDLLSPHENIRLWMREQIDLQSGQKGTIRGYGPLAGRPSSITVSQKWVCPISRCNESLPVIQEAEDPPICDVHGVKMIRRNRKKG